MSENNLHHVSSWVDNWSVFRAWKRQTLTNKSTQKRYSTICNRLCWRYYIFRTMAHSPNGGNYSFDEPRFAVTGFTKHQPIFPTIEPARGTNCQLHNSHWQNYRCVCTPKSDSSTIPACHQWPLIINRPTQTDRPTVNPIASTRLLDDRIVQLWLPASHFHEYIIPARECLSVLRAECKFSGNQSKWHRFLVCVWCQLFCTKHAPSLPGCHSNRWLVRSKTRA